MSTSSIVNPQMAQILANLREGKGFGGEEGEPGAAVRPTRGGPRTAARSRRARSGSSRGYRNGPSSSEILGRRVTREVNRLPTSLTNEELVTYGADPRQVMARASRAKARQRLAEGGISNRMKSMLMARPQDVQMGDFDEKCLIGTENLTPWQVNEKCATLGGGRFLPLVSLAASSVWADQIGNGVRGNITLRQFEQAVYEAVRAVLGAGDFQNLWTQQAPYRTDRYALRSGKGPFRTYKQYGGRARRGGAPGGGAAQMSLEGL